MPSNAGSVGAYPEAHGSLSGTTWPLLVLQVQAKDAPASPLSVHTGARSLDSVFGVLTPGAAGAVRSTRTCGLEAVVLLPAASVRVTSSCHVPSPETALVQSVRHGLTADPDAATFLRSWQELVVSVAVHAQSTAVMLR